MLTLSQRAFYFGKVDVFIECVNLPEIAALNASQAHDTFLCMLLALAGQISLGISNVLLHLPLALAVAHNLGGAFLLLTLVAINYRLRSSSGAAIAAPSAHGSQDPTRSAQLPFT